MRELPAGRELRGVRVRLSAALLAGTLAFVPTIDAVENVTVVAPASSPAGVTTPINTIRAIGPSSGSATGERIDLRIVATTSVPVSGIQASVIFDRSRLRIVDVVPGEAWAAPTAMLAGFPTKDDADVLLSNANSAGMLAQFAAFFVDGKSSLPAAEVEIASISFVTTGCGDTQIELPLGPRDGALLDGRASSYGRLVDLLPAATMTIKIGCAPGETAPATLKSSRPTASGAGQGVASATCPVIFDFEGNARLQYVISEAEGPFETLWTPWTDLHQANNSTSQALSNLRNGVIEVAGADRPLTPEEASDTYYWQIGLNGATSFYIAVRNTVLGNRTDDSSLVRADDLVNYMLSGAGQLAVTSAGYESVPIPDTPPIPDYDVNLDGTVGLADLGNITGRWGQTASCPGWIRADVNNDGAIGLADLGRVTGEWGAVGFEPPPPVPACEGAYHNRHLGWEQGGGKWGAIALLADGPLNICGNPTELTNAASLAFSNIEGGNGQNSIVQVGVGRCRKLLSGECDGRRKVLWAWGREAGDLFCPLQWPFPQELEVWDGSPGDAKVQREGSDWVFYWKGTERRRIPYSSTSCSWAPVRATFFTETWNDGDSNGGYQHAKYAIRHMAYQNSIGGAYSFVNTDRCNLPNDDPPNRYFCTASSDEAHTWTAR